MATQGDGQKQAHNWSNHPVIVAIVVLGAISTILGFAYGIYHNANKTEVVDNGGTPNPSPTVLKQLGSNLEIGLYVISDADGLGNDFIQKMRLVVKELKLKRVTIIKLVPGESVWAVPGKDFDFIWEGSNQYLLDVRYLEKFNELATYLRSPHQGPLSANCSNIFDIKNRISQDHYSFNILATKEVYICGGNEVSQPDGAAVKKILILPGTRRASNPQAFYVDLKTLERAFPAAKILPFVSVDKKQIVEFLRSTE